MVKDLTHPIFMVKDLTHPIFQLSYSIRNALMASTEEIASAAERMAMCPQ
jgi:hypothetical protein